MWASEVDVLSGGRVRQIRILRDQSRVTYAETIAVWQHDESFRTFFIQLLADSPFSAFRWETPAISSATQDQPFEFVVLDSPGLASRPDQKAFAEHFTKAGTASVLAFPNLSGDATLVVPCPIASASVYGHIAAFLRGAPAEQKHALWQLVGTTLQQRLGNKPIWLSTAGAGVSWLHVRLDRSPKYYGFAAYR
jgi:hypothetical protein